MSDLTIRHARAEELAAIGDLTVRAYQADGAIKGGYERMLADAAGRHRDAEVLVAVDGSDRILGTVTIARGGQQWADIAQPGELEFRMLAVDPAARRRGIGEALVRAVLERAKEVGAARVMLSSQRTMLVAHRVYERLGFRRAPDRDWVVQPGLSLIAYGVEVR
ncbi:MAG: GNAT family N-acetyltransferase [Labedaea sp.]